MQFCLILYLDQILNSRVILPSLLCTVHLSRFIPWMVLCGSAEQHRSAVMQLANARSETSQLGKVGIGRARSSSWRIRFSNFACRAGRGPGISLKTRVSSTMTSMATRAWLEHGSGHAKSRASVPSYLASGFA